MKRYASWGSDQNYRWLWRAALQDAVWAFRIRMSTQTRKPRSNLEIKQALNRDDHIAVANRTAGNE